LFDLLIKAGANVKVILTDSAALLLPHNLSLPLLDAVLFFIVRKTERFMGITVELGLLADIVYCARHGICRNDSEWACDNFLMAAYLSAKCPVYFVLQLDLDLFGNPSTKQF